MRSALLTATTFVAITMGSGISAAQAVHTLSPVPMSRLHYARLKAQQPALLQQYEHPVTRVFTAPAPRVPGGPWQPLTNQPPFSAGAMLLLTDGTVLVQDQSAPQGGSGSAWWRLTPDSSGSYLNGAWTQLASMQAGYTPLYFGSAVLPDGRVIVEGGEYNGGPAVWTGQGSIYDPVVNAWTAVAPPAGMNLDNNSIGDAQGTVLANGTFMLSPVYVPPSGDQQLLNPTTLTWTASGTNKATGNDEAGQALLTTGKILTVDISSPSLHSEAYNSHTGLWSSAGSTVVQIWDDNGEMGPMVTRPDGSTFVVGSGLGNTAIYKGATWTAGPSFPVIGGAQFGTADGPGSVLPSGKVLVLASAGYTTPPSHFFVFDGTSLTQTVDTPNCPNIPAFQGYMVTLPTGQVMFNDRVGDVELYTDTGLPNRKWAPQITDVPTTLIAGTTYPIYGSQLNGVTIGASYGDDYQSATNYPLVRITNKATGHVFYARTSQFSSMSIAHFVNSSANFTPPVGMETGPSKLVVVANGIASASVAVTITP